MTTTTSSGSRTARIRRFALPTVTPILLSTVALFVISALIVPRTLGASSLQSMLPFAAVLAIAAAGQTLVIQQRGIDLSVGGIIALAAILTSSLAEGGVPTVPAVVATLLTCAAIGVINGVLVTRLSIPPLVATLAVNAMLTSAALVYTKGAAATAPQDLTAFVTRDLGGVPVIAWISVIVVVVTATFMGRAAFGRRFVFAGASPKAANTAAIRPTRYVMSAYLAGSTLFGLAGILLAGYLRNTTAGLGGPYLISVIAAVVVGGTALRGGKGTIVGSAIAALFLTQLVQLVLALGAPTSTQMLVQAIVIAVAAGIGAIAGKTVRKTAPAVDGPPSAPADPSPRSATPSESLSAPTPPSKDQGALT